MTRTILLTAVAAAALAGCNSQETITAGPDEGNQAAIPQNVTLPPTISATKIYRCADNTVVYVDWLSDNKTANVRTEKNGAPTQVTAAEAGKSMTGPAGYEVSGSADAASVQIAVPGHKLQSCKA
jgi:outer membrane lipoprotein SlyB